MEVDGHGVAGDLAVGRAAARLVEQKFVAREAIEPDGDAGLFVLLHLFGRGEEDLHRGIGDMGFYQLFEVWLTARTAVYSLIIRTCGFGFQTSDFGMRPIVPGRAG